MKNIFYFGEKIEGFDIRVLNEREVRASAGILFFFAMIAFMNAWLTGNFYITKIFVIAFLVDDVIKRYYNKIKESGAILVLNLEKNGIANYIGGNTFLEMGFAHVLDKKIYLFNNIPESSYRDELVAMQPIVLNGDLGEIK